MDDPQSLDGQLAEAIFAEMIRSGLLPVDLVERVQRQFEDEAQSLAGSSRGERFETLGRMAMQVAMAGQGPTPSQWRAEQRRKQMRLQTKGLDATRGEADGN